MGFEVYNPESGRSNMRRYPEEVKKFIAENVRDVMTRDLVALVNEKFGLDFTMTKMQSYKKNHGLKNGRSHGIPVGKPTKLYPGEVKDFIKTNHKGVGPKEMSELLNGTFGTKYTHSQMKGYYARFKLDSGVTGYFPKGHTTFNRGMKGITYPGCVPTQFKKGNRPANWRPLESERISKDGYIEVKVADGRLNKNWKAKHIVIYEQHNGPVPPGRAVIFGDGDRRNFDPANLICVSRAQLARLNQMRLIQDDAELTKAGVTIADIHNKIGERKKTLKGGSQND